MRSSLPFTTRTRRQAALVPNFYASIVKVLFGSKTRRWEVILHSLTYTTDMEQMTCRPLALCVFSGFPLPIYEIVEPFPPRPPSRSALATCGEGLDNQGGVRGK